jgi:hypothetical protein
MPSMLPLDPSAISRPETRLLLRPPAQLIQPPGPDRLQAVTQTGHSQTRPGPRACHPRHVRGPFVFHPRPEPQVRGRPGFPPLYCVKTNPIAPDLPRRNEPNRPGSPLMKRKQSAEFNRLPVIARAFRNSYPRSPWECRPRRSASSPFEDVADLTSAVYDPEGSSNPEGPERPARSSHARAWERVWNRAGSLNSVEGV